MESATFLLYTLEFMLQIHWQLNAIVCNSDQKFLILAAKTTILKFIDHSELKCKVSLLKTMHDFKPTQLFLHPQHSSYTFLSVKRQSFV